MGGPFRSDLHAAVARLQALEHENARLHAALAAECARSCARPHPNGAHGVRAASAGRAQRVLEALAVVAFGAAILVNLANAVIPLLPPIDTAESIQFRGARGR